MKTERLTVVGAVLALGLLLVAPAFAQQPFPACAEVEFFPQTGHNVCDRFLAFFNSRGDASIFGYPITDAFYENGRWVQYFQRVRMEYHPELVPAYHVQLGLLADQFAPPERKAPIGVTSRPKSNDPHRRYFPETGHSVELGFLDFYNNNGGLDIFGYPLTEYFDESGRWVQYFQRALMEWDPNEGIVLHPLGEMWVDQHEDLWASRGSPPLLIMHESRAQPLDAVNALRATISVRHASVGTGGEQTVWVYVNDANGRPVEGARVMLIASFMSGGPAIPMPPTDEYGHTRTTFRLVSLTAGQLVTLTAPVAYGGLTTTAETFFMAWW